MQERRRGLNAGSDDFQSLFKAAGEAAYCIGLALAAVAFVLALHSFVVFRGQAASFLYVIGNNKLEDLRITIIVSAVLLSWAVVDMVYRQTMLTDIALVDWERPQQVIGERGQHVEGPVSCWRSVFVANEFAELSAARRSRPALSFIMLVRALPTELLDRCSLRSPHVLVTTCVSRA